MTTNKVETDSAIEFVTAETTKHGFTNWRVTVGKQPLTCQDCRIDSPLLGFQDLAALSYHLKFNCSLANQFLAASYKAAFDYVSQP